MTKNEYDRIKAEVGKFMTSEKMAETQTYQDEGLIFENHQHFMEYLKAKS